MITSGFYNSVNHDRQYDAAQISSIFDGIINDGVYLSQGNKFAVKASTGMQVNVDTGRAWFNHTWTVNDALLPLTVPTAESILKRIDSVVLEINATPEVRSNSIKIVKGTPASSPVAPTLVHDKDVNQYRLANIMVSPGATSITNGDITITVGTGDCPFVTGILETTNIDDVYAKWESQFSEWFAGLQNVLEEDPATKLYKMIMDVHEEVNDVKHTFLGDMKFQLIEKDAYQALVNSGTLDNTVAYMIYKKE